MGATFVRVRSHKVQRTNECKEANMQAVRKTRKEENLLHRKLASSLVLHHPSRSPAMLLPIRPFVREKQGNEKRKR